MDVKVANKYWDITTDPTNGYIYMNPKNGKHEQTVIFLHGYEGNATNFYETFAKDMEAPANTRIILPQAPFRWNPIWGGDYARSWWTLIKQVKSIKDEEDYRPFFNQTEIIEFTDQANAFIEAERLKLPD